MQDSNTVQEARVPEWFGGAARALAPQPLAQVFFLLVYAVWWVPAAPIWGAFVFGACVVLAGSISAVALRNLRLALRFPSVPTEEGRRIGQAMGRLMGWSYGVLWMLVIVLALTGSWRFIMPTVAAVIAVHFLPLAKIFRRRIDYLLSPVALVPAVLGIALAADPAVEWPMAAAVGGSGAAVATAVYSLLMLRDFAALRRAALG